MFHLRRVPGLEKPGRAVSFINDTCRGPRSKNQTCPAARQPTVSISQQALHSLLHGYGYGASHLCTLYTSTSETSSPWHGQQRTNHRPQRSINQAGRPVEPRNSPTHALWRGMGEVGSGAVLSRYVWMYEQRFSVGLFLSIYSPRFLEETSRSGEEERGQKTQSRKERKEWLAPNPIQSKIV